MNDSTLEQAREILCTANLVKRGVTQRYTEGHKQGMENLPCAEMTFPQSMAVMAVHDRGSLTIKELAEQLHVSPPSASAMVDRLVEMGMLVREQSREDRREVIIQVSGKGAENLRDVENHVLAFIVELLEEMGPEMARQWCEVYARVRQIIEGKFRVNAADIAKEKIL